MKINLNNIEQYREGNRLEVKLAQKGLPMSLWETYSAFANTDGGLVLSSGEWSGNLFDFFFKVFPRLTDGLPRPFVMRNSSRIDETPLHDALHELLLNALVHADHYGRQGIVVVKTKDFYSFSNPGDIRIGLNVALSGGVSDSRNAVIMKMFALIDKVERTGMGIPQAIDSWQELLDVTPHYQVTYNPERTTVRLEVEVVNDPINVQMNDPDVQKIAQNVQKNNAQNGTKNGIKNGIKNLTNRQKTIVDMLKKDGSITMEVLSKQLRVSMRTINREMSLLQEMKRIERIGSKTNGKWSVL
ncbi:MAG: HTH domain-containing protein [Bacteroidales bacterium]|nr:HTH domain-containing protein [Bacteroidales bacterium]